MRAPVAMLGCLAVGALSLALADPPATAPASSAAPPAAAAPASTPAAAPAAALSEKEKELLAKGYKMEMRHGERVFCRYEEELGSRVGGRKICGSADPLLVTQRAAKESVEQIQQRQANPTGK